DVQLDAADSESRALRRDAAAGASALDAAGDGETRSALAHADQAAPELPVRCEAPGVTTVLDRAPSPALRATPFPDRARSRMTATTPSRSWEGVARSAGEAAPVQRTSSTLITWALAPSSTHSSPASLSIARPDACDTSSTPTCAAMEPSSAKRATTPSCVP